MTEPIFPNEIFLQIGLVHVGAWRAIAQVLGHLCAANRTFAQSKFVGLRVPTVCAYANAEDLVLFCDKNLVRVSLQGYKLFVAASFDEMRNLRELCLFLYNVWFSGRADVGACGRYDWLPADCENREFLCAMLSTTFVVQKYTGGTRCICQTNYLSVEIKWPQNEKISLSKNRCGCVTRTIIYIGPLVYEGVLVWDSGRRLPRFMATQKKKNKMNDDICVSCFLPDNSIFAGQK